MDINPLTQRRAGVLLHPTSLPSARLDSDVLRWIDFLDESGLSVWQMLPMVIPDSTNSPYQSRSAFAMDPALLPDGEFYIDNITSYLQQEGYWLKDFALFQVLKTLYSEQPWYEWPEEYRHRDPEALNQIAKKHHQAIERIYRQQCLLDQKWRSIRLTANDKDIALFGDIPIFVSLDSADVWANPGEFLLDENLQPTYVTGVPPDYFSETGQRWGNPHYNWDAMEANGFSWWKMRLQRQLHLFDIIRLDHFRGLDAVWMIESSSETALNGYWQKTPGAALLDTLQHHFPLLPIVAEDLGLIDDAVRALKKQFALPGMSVLQFAFDHFEDNPHKPVNITPDTVVYTGTHDNDTTLGWFNSLDSETQDFVFQTLGIEPTDDIAGAMIETALRSNANLAIFPLQDLLGLDSESRMNTPGSSEGNWEWQFQWSMIPERLKSQMRQLIQESGRVRNEN
jgi:4-alpha-glucanotransferase